MKYVSEYEMYELVQAQYITSNTVSRSTGRVSYVRVHVCLSHMKPMNEQHGAVQCTVCHRDGLGVVEG